MLCNMLSSCSDCEAVRGKPSNTQPYECKSIRVRVWACACACACEMCVCVLAMQCGDEQHANAVVSAGVGASLLVDMLSVLRV